MHECKGPRQASQPSSQSQAQLTARRPGVFCRRVLNTLDPVAAIFPGRLLAPPPKSQAEWLAEWPNPPDCPDPACPKPGGADECSGERTL